MLKKTITMTALAALVATATSSFAEEYTASDKARMLAKENLLIDTHIDVPYRIHNEWRM